MTNKAAEAQTWRRLLASRDLPADLRALYTDEVIAEVCALAGDEADPVDVRASAELAARAYLEVRLHRQRRAPGKREAKQLERLANGAHSFARALESLPKGRAAAIKLRGALNHAAAERADWGADLALVLTQIHGPGDPM